MDGSWVGDGVEDAAGEGGEAEGGVAVDEKGGERWVLVVAVNDVPCVELAEGFGVCAEV